jgi:hypothetical protein
MIVLFVLFSHKNGIKQWDGIFILKLARNEIGMFCGIDLSFFERGYALFWTLENCIWL